MAVLSNPAHTRQRFWVKKGVLPANPCKEAFFQALAAATPILSCHSKRPASSNLMYLCKAAASHWMSGACGVAGASSRSSSVWIAAATTPLLPAPVANGCRADKISGFHVGLVPTARTMHWVLQNRTYVPKILILQLLPQLVLDNGTFRPHPQLHGRALARRSGGIFADSKQCFVWKAMRL